MRIRSIMPEFWRSEDVGAMDWDTRLVFIGLWSYVDDNGVGRDNGTLIASDLFPYDLASDAERTLARVSRALARLAAGSRAPKTDPQITRYTVDGVAYVHITAWSRYQRIDRPSRGRYPRPTSENAILDPNPRDTLASPRDTLATGEGEKGRRGEVNTYAHRGADAPTARVHAHPEDPTFDEFWAAYPRRRAKARARKAWAAATRKAPTETILAALQAQLPDLTNRPPDKIPYPATWLNGDSWTDELPTTATVHPLGPWERLPDYTGTGGVA